MDSQVEISMTVMWPLESWPEFSQVVMNLLEGRSRQHLGEDGSQGTSVLDLRFTQMSRATASGCTGCTLHNTRDCELRGTTCSCAEHTSYKKASYFSTVEQGHRFDAK